MGLLATQTSECAEIVSIQIRVRQNYCLFQKLNLCHQDSSSKWKKIQYL